LHYYLLYPEAKGKAMRLSNQDANFLRLLMRSPDRGDGWRTVSATCWPLVTAFQAVDLIEIDKQEQRVRLTGAGEAVAMYAI